jgi:hypothetical protein
MPSGRLACFHRDSSLLKACGAKAPEMWWEMAHSGLTLLAGEFIFTA